jgi:hypothetical protein
MKEFKEKRFVFSNGHKLLNNNDDDDDEILL